MYSTEANRNVEWSLRWLFVEGSKLAKKRKTDSKLPKKITKKPEEIVNFKLNGKTDAIGYNMIKREEWHVRGV